MTPDAGQSMVGRLRLANFKGLLRKVHLRTEAGFWPRFHAASAVRWRSGQYQFEYQVREGVTHSRARERTTQAGSNSHARRSISRPSAVAFYLAGDRFVQLGETVDVRLHRELETDG